MNIPYFSTLPAPFILFLMAFLPSFLEASDDEKLPDTVRAALERELGGTPEILESKRTIYNEYNYSEKSMGYRFTADQWRESQAWQSLSGYNKSKQARHHDIDSLVWCTLRGGGNSVTYMKPLIDFFGHAKLAYYTYRSALQDYFPASRGVDIAYGPGDEITPVIVSLGDETRADLTIRCLDESGRVADTQTFRGVQLPAGRKITTLDSYRPKISGRGFYAVTYTLTSIRGELGRTFELRYFTDDPDADGDTDFQEGNGVLDTAQRVEFLRHYADQASRFFEDPNLDRKVLQAGDVEKAMDRLKPQPLPEIRKRIRLNDGWATLARREDETASDGKRLADWPTDGVDIEEGGLVFKNDGVEVTKAIDPQDWRFLIEWTATHATGKPLEFSLGGDDGPMLEVKISGNGQVTAGGNAAGNIRPGSAFHLKAEIDLQYGQFNLYLDGERTVYAGSVPDTLEVNALTLRGGSGARIEQIWGVGYDPAEDIRNGIFEIATFIDEDFSVTPEITGWETADYDDSSWTSGAELPHIVGSERHQGRDIFLRRMVEVPEFERAVLNVESLDPQGEIFVNGQPAAQLSRGAHQVDVTSLLQKGDNLIALRVRHPPEGFFEADGHTSKDLHFGWFAARLSLDLTAPVVIEDIFVTTEEIGGPAKLKVRAEVTNHSSKDYSGEAIIKLFPWYPEESARSAAEERVNVSVAAGETVVVEKEIEVTSPQLWHYRDPRLYKVSVALSGPGGRQLDDLVVTTGIRTLDEEGGIFRLNGEEDVLNGATWMQFPAPLTESTTWHRCCPEEWIVKGVLMTQALNGYTLRKHEPSRSYSDPRFAEIGDQLGMMYIWVSTGWARKEWTGTNKHPDGKKMSVEESVEEYVANMKQIRNHPSVVMWEIFNEGVRKKEPLYEAFYPSIYETDSSRLIMPIKGFFRDEARVVKGGQIDTLGYGGKWEGLRKQPLDHLGKFEKSDRYGMYSVEFAELTGQDNWNLVKGKPWYKVHSYEWGTPLYKIKCRHEGKDHQVMISEEGRVISRK